MVRSGDIPVHLETMEPGAMYCVKAQALVKAIGRHSAFSQPTCVEMQGKDNLLVPGSLHLAALPLHAWMPVGCLVLSLSLALPPGLLPGLVGSKVNSDSPMGGSPPWGLDRIS
jgi:interleukin 20 receptor beta